MKEVFKTDYVEIVFDEDAKVLMVTWSKANFTSEQYRDVWERSIQVGKDNDVLYYLSDIINQKVVTPEDRTWFEENAIERAIATGLTKGGIVLGANPFKRYYFNNIMKKIGGTDLPFKAFKNREAAYKWFLG